MKSLVDSSALIEYYRSDGSSVTQAEVAKLIEADRIAVNGIIRVEILAFAKNDIERAKLESDFDAFHTLPLGDDEFDLASSIGYDLRRRGLTVPSTDLIIAASAITADAEVVHLDEDFVRIAEVSDLMQRDLRR